MSKIDLLRKLIREEVKAAIREELPKILNENISEKYDYKKNIQEQIKSKVPGTLNTPEKKPIKFSGSPMAQFLNDTAKTMLNEDFSMSTQDVHPSLAFQPKDVKVGSVEGMLGTARPSSNIDAVQINEVPDFSALMSKMKQNGQI